LVTVTERAAAELQELLKAQNASDAEGVKLVPGGDGRVQMTISEPGAGDQVTQRDGHPLLIVDAAIVDTLDGTEVDFQSGSEDGAQPPGFTLRPTETPS
jgi:Fe-S cluster assembly iron-binding protein IscA